jgi:flagellar biosynthesis/type III secretory pathway protein FliH
MAETENGMVDMSIPVQISQLQEAVEEAFMETKLND